MFGGSPVLAVLAAVIFAVVLGGAMSAILLVKLRKISPITPSVTVSASKETMLKAEQAVDKKMDELNEVHEQSLRGMKLDVMAELAKPPPPATPLDARVDELKKMTKSKIK